MNDDDDQTPLDTTAAAVVRALSGDGGLAPSMLAVLSHEMTSRARTAGVPDNEVEELVDAVLVRFVQASRSGRVSGSSAGAYLASSLRNAAVDSYRARSRAEHVSLDRHTAHLPVDDDALVRLLAADAARGDVYAALSQAVCNKRFTLVRVVTQWLQIAELTGEEPASRQVAFALDLSHTTVNEALREFRGLLATVSQSDVEGSEPRLE